MSLDNLALKFGIKTPEDWYSVSNKTVIDHGATFINTKYNGSLLRGYILYHNTVLTHISVANIVPRARMEKV